MGRSHTYFPANRGVTPGSPTRGSPRPARGVGAALHMPDPPLEGVLAEAAVRHATRALERRGYTVVGHGPDGVAGYADPAMRFDMVLEPAPGEYSRRVLHVRSAYVAGDAELARIERAPALGEWIRHLRTPRTW